MTVKSKPSVVQVDLDLDRESVTSPEQQVMLLETADENGMFSSTQPFCDTSDQKAVKKESSHVTRAMSSHVGHAHNSVVQNITELRWGCFRFHVRLLFPQLDSSRHVNACPAFLGVRAAHAPVQE